MKPKIWDTDALYAMQVECHRLGRDGFIRMVIEILYRASQDTENFENKTLSERYQSAAIGIQNLLDDGTLGDES